MPTAGHAWSSKEIISMEGALIYGFFQKAKRIFRDLEYDTFTHPRSMGYPRLVTSSTSCWPKSEKDSWFCNHLHWITFSLKMIFRCVRISEVCNLLHMQPLTLSIGRPSVILFCNCLQLRFKVLIIAKWTTHGTTGQRFQVPFRWFNVFSFFWACGVEPSCSNATAN